MHYLENEVQLYNTCFTQYASTDYVKKVKLGEGKNNGESQVINIKTRKIGGWGWNPINRFNPATFLSLSQTRTRIFNV